MAETAGHRPTSEELRAEQAARRRRRDRAARARARAAEDTICNLIECARCQQDRPHKARGLCQNCYEIVRRAGDLPDYPLVQDRSMDNDDIAVDRAVHWLQAHAALPPALRRDDRANRPHLTQGERIQVLARTRHTVPKWVAIGALGINGTYATRYLKQATP